MKLLNPDWEQYEDMKLVKWVEWRFSDAPQWSDLTEVQQVGATILGFDEDKWNYDDLPWESDEEEGEDDY